MRLGDWLLFISVVADIQITASYFVEDYDEREDSGKLFLFERL